jgi:hypothetical protein
MNRLDREAALNMQPTDLNRLVEKILGAKRAAVNDKKLASQLSLSKDPLKIRADAEKLVLSLSGYEA